MYSYVTIGYAMARDSYFCVSYFSFVVVTLILDHWFPSLFLKMRINKLFNQNKKQSFKIILLHTPRSLYYLQNFRLMSIKVSSQNGESLKQGTSVIFPGRGSVGSASIVCDAIINKLNLTCAFLPPLFSSQLMVWFPFCRAFVQ